MMKLVLTIVQDTDAENLLEKMTERGFRATKFATTGGFLRRGNSTILIGVEDDQVGRLMDTIKANCDSQQIEKRANAYIGEKAFSLCGATVFVLDVEQFHRF